jgi:hypothetical protein
MLQAVDPGRDAAPEYLAKAAELDQLAERCPVYSDLGQVYRQLALSYRLLAQPVAARRAAAPQPPGRL